MFKRFYYRFFISKQKIFNRTQGQAEIGDYFTLNSWMRLYKSTSRLYSLLDNNLTQVMINTRLSAYGHSGLGNLSDEDVTEHFSTVGPANSLYLSRGQINPWYTPLGWFWRRHGSPLHALAATTLPARDLFLHRLHARAHSLTSVPAC